MCRNTAYYLLPGKSGNDGTYLPLWMHLEDTADTMAYLCEHRVSKSVINATELSPDDFIRVCIFTSMVHDLGKCTPLFASKLTIGVPEIKEKMAEQGLQIPDYTKFLNPDVSRHARAGEALLEQYGVPNGICSIVGAHHGKPTSEIDINDGQLETYGFNYYAKQKTVWAALQQAFLEAALKRAGYHDTQELPRLSNPAQMLLTGLLIQADWIASNQYYYPLIQVSDQGVNNKSRHTARSENAFLRLQLPKPWTARKTVPSAEDFYRNRFGFSANEMQQRVAEIAMKISQPGLMIIEAQMGTGKTEAALAAAEIFAYQSKCGGVFFGLPTQATSNGIFPRLTAWANAVSAGGMHTIRLVHGMAELNEDYRSFYKGNAITDDVDGAGGLFVHSWFTGKKQALLADFVVGTVDTALMAALNQKHVMLRHLGLCGKVVIIDECHAYDAYMGEYLCKMLRWLGIYKIPIILLSATLPAKSRATLIRAYLGNTKLEIPQNTGYPCITWTDGEAIGFECVDDRTKSRVIEVQRIQEDQLAEVLGGRLKDSGCVGVIVNTVHRAQRIYKELKEKLPDKTVLVYHSQFVAEDRIEREKNLIGLIGKNSTSELRNGVIVVGTQVLEQSLDIDFDFLVTDLCPMDLLLQRIGRLHRHERPRLNGAKEPVCAVMGTEGELEPGTKAIYGEWLLEQTKKCLPVTLRFPADIPLFVNRVYAEPEENSRDFEKYQNKIEIQKSKARSWLLPEPRKSRRELGNSIVGMMDNANGLSEQSAEATVRDGLPSVDVLVLRRVDEEHVGFIAGELEMTFRMDSIPSEEECLRIAKQRMHLPTAFCIGKALTVILQTLEQERVCYFSAWQNSSLLKEELILLLNDRCEKELCGYRIKYSEEQGLTYERNG